MTFRDYSGSIDSCFALPQKRVDTLEAWVVRG
jgi:hypothetical protein